MNMPQWSYGAPLISVMAIARIHGGPTEPQIRGVVWFTNVPGGTQVCIEVYGLPPYQPAKDQKYSIGPHGFHIHQFGNCEPGSSEKPFPATGEHWNPTYQPHGNHPGDFPVLFSNNGYSWMCFFTNRFRVRDVIGRSVVIHENPDDYRTQPSGTSGKKIACGVIESFHG